MPRATRKILDKHDNSLSFMIKHTGSSRQGSGYDALAQCMARTPEMVIPSCMVWIGVLPDLIHPVMALLSRSLGQMQDGSSGGAYFTVLRRFPNFPDTLMTHLKSAVRSFIESAPSADPRAISRNRDIMVLISKFIWTLSVFDSVQPQWGMRQYLAAHARSIFTTTYEILRMVDAAPQSRISPQLVTEFLPDLVHLAKKFYPLVKKDIPNAPQMYKTLLKQPEPSDGDMPATMLLSEITDIQGWRRCLNPSCFPTSVEGSAKHRCAGCLVYYYCSRQCQQAGWKDPRHPHKLACKKLGALRSVWKWDEKGGNLNNPPLGYKDGYEEWLTSVAESVGVKKEELVGLQTLVRKLHQL